MVDDATIYSAAYGLGWLPEQADVEDVEDTGTNEAQFAGFEPKKKKAGAGSTLLLPPNDEDFFLPNDVVGALKRTVRGLPVSAKVRAFAIEENRKAYMYWYRTACFSPVDVEEAARTAERKRKKLHGDSGSTWGQKVETYKKKARKERTLEGEVLGLDPIFDPSMKRTMKNWAAKGCYALARRLLARQNKRVAQLRSAKNEDRVKAGAHFWEQAENPSDRPMPLFVRAIELNPDHSIAAYNAGVLAFNAEESEEARRHLEQAAMPVLRRLKELRKEKALKKKRAKAAKEAAEKAAYAAALRKGVDNKFETEDAEAPAPQPVVVPQPQTQGPEGTLYSQHTHAWADLEMLRTESFGMDALFMRGYMDVMDAGAERGPEAEAADEGDEDEIDILQQPEDDDAEPGYERERETIKVPIRYVDKREEHAKASAAKEQDEPQIIVDADEDDDADDEPKKEKSDLELHREQELHKRAVIKKVRKERRKRGRSAKKQAKKLWKDALKWHKWLKKRLKADSRHSQREKQKLLDRTNSVAANIKEQMADL